jgi:hypothetical protein
VYGNAGILRKPPLMYLRTLAAHAEDGRWSWYESGTEQAFEDPSRYTRRRIRDRLDRPLLIDYLASMGISADDPDFYGAGVSVRQHVNYPVRRLTAEQVRKDFGWS